jgi:circadian clock protein KaiB
MTDDVPIRPGSPAQNSKYVLRLYVLGNTPQSSRAITNLKLICEAHLKDRYDLTVIDLYEQQHQRAAEDQILVVPTLVRRRPLPVRRVVGDLSQTNRVLAVLDLLPDLSSL